MTNILRRLGRQDGMALVVAVGFLAVLTIVAGTMIGYTSTNSRSGNVQKARTLTEQYAESGLARALSVLANAPNATAPTNLPGVTETFASGSVYYSGILAGETWNITSVASVINPTGAGDLHKTLTAQVQIGIDPDGNNAWNYVYSDAPSTQPCMTISNTVEIEAPLFVKGNLCLEQSAKAKGSMVKVGGTIQLVNTSYVGDPDTSPDTYVPELKTAGGCRYGSSGAFSLANCSTSNHVYATSTTSDPGTLVKPVVDFAYWYANAQPGPMHACTTGSVPFSWDTNTTLDRAGDRNVEIMTSTAYSCTVWSGSHLLGKIAWTPDDGDADSYGNMELLGTIFIDGNLDMSANKQAIYTGRGTIYASGKIDMGTSRQLCGALNCDVNAWDPEQALLVMVSGYCLDVIESCDEVDQRTDGFTIGQSGIFQGAVFATSDFHSTSTGEMQGPVIAHQLKFEQRGVANKWVAIEAMTMGTPGGGRKLNVLNIGGY